MASATWLILPEELAVVMGRHIGPNSWLAMEEEEGRQARGQSKLIANHVDSVTQLRLSAARAL